MTTELFAEVFFGLALPMIVGAGLAFIYLTTGDTLWKARAQRIVMEFRLAPGRYEIWRLLGMPGPGVTSFRMVETSILCNEHWHHMRRMHVTEFLEVANPKNELTSILMVVWYDGVPPFHIPIDSVS